MILLQILTIVLVLLFGVYICEGSEPFLKVFNRVKDRFKFKKDSSKTVSTNQFTADHFNNVADIMEQRRCERVRLAVERERLNKERERLIAERDYKLKMLREERDYELKKLRENHDALLNRLRE